MFKMHEVLTVENLGQKSSLAAQIWLPINVLHLLRRECWRTYSLITNNHSMSACMQESTVCASAIETEVIIKHPCMHVHSHDMYKEAV